MPSITSSKGVIYTALILLVIYLTKILGTGQSLTDLGKGISNFLSPQITPTFMPTIGLRFGISWLGDQSSGNTDPNAYLNNQIYYSQSGLGETPTIPIIPTIPDYNKPKIIAF